nr:MAG TPA: hypothetical protein [Bacteriophage sp.]
MPVYFCYLVSRSFNHFGKLLKGLPPRLVKTRDTKARRSAGTGLRQYSRG